MSSAPFLFGASRMWLAFASAWTPVTRQIAPFLLSRGQRWRSLARSASFSTACGSMGRALGGSAAAARCRKARPDPSSARADLQIEAEASEVILSAWTYRRLTGTVENEYETLRRTDRSKLSGANNLQRMLNWF